MLAFMACKEKVSDVNNSSKENVGVENQGPIVRCQLHRATTSRPRDGKYCGCQYCFGLCDCVFFPNGSGTVSNVYVETFFNNNTLDTGQGKIYILEQSSEMESEFGVDVPIELPQEVAATHGAQNITVLPNMYHFNQIQEMLTLPDGTQVTSYGYVYVNLDITL